MTLRTANAGTLHAHWLEQIATGSQPLQGRHSVAPFPSKLRILIADDDNICRHLLATSLVRWGCQIISASDGNMAQKMLREGGIDMCILDWEMPGVSGIELAAWLRASKMAAKPYVILLTSNDSPADIETAYRAGADEHFAKPCDLQRLWSRVISKAHGNPSA